MAVYKVPQDVEADDKLIGPFTFRQFVFILLMVGFLYLTYLFFTLTPFMAIFPLLPAGFFGVLGLWPRKDQPVEIYLAALIHFWTQPRKKIWNQEGMVEHVKITAPKKVAHQFTDGLDTNEVKSRLHNLASTLDSRGWSAKNVPADTAPYSDQSAQFNPQQQSDRLVMPQVASSNATMQNPITTAEEDVLDSVNNPVGRNLQQMVDKTESDRKEALVQQIKDAATTQPSSNPQTDDEVDFNPYPDMQQNTVQPMDQAQASSTDNKPAENDVNQGSEAAPSNAIINLANNSDLNVSTLARQAEQAEDSLNSGDTIELH